MISVTYIQSILTCAILKNILNYDITIMSCPGASDGVCYMYKWGQTTLASIQGGMSMVNNILSFVSFGAFLLELFVNSSVLPRLLGVTICNMICLIKSIVTITVDFYFTKKQCDAAYTNYSL